jgi:hypothetical protein
MFLVSFLPKNIKDKIKNVVFFSKCKFRKFFRSIFSFKTRDKIKNSFVILCVKNTNYCDLVIDNVNSLHFLNPRYNFIIYCDKLCADYLKNKINQFDYPQMVITNDVFGIGNLPWQKYKIETLIDASKKDYILTDADGIWHEEPEIISDKINILTLAYKVGDNKNEKLLIEKLFNKPEWSNFGHYVTGFVYIPASFMTVELQKKMRDFVSKILDSDLNFMELSNVSGTKRIAEELAVNFAIQSLYTNNFIVTLKQKDGPGSNEKLQSLYYGCTNNINV